MTAQEIATAIIQGEFDSAELDRIANAIYRRRKLLEPTIYDFEPGDKVVLNSKVKPKYLAGTPGIVIERKQTRVVIRIDAPKGRYGTTLTCPPAILTKAN